MAIGISIDYAAATPTSKLDTFLNMRPKPLVAIMSEQAEHKRSGKGKARRMTAETKRKRGQHIPSYEALADWRGIEHVLTESRQDPKTPADFPGIMSPGKFPVTQDDKPMLGLSPMEMVAQNQTHVTVGSLEEAIASARAALRPHLDCLAAEEMRNAYQGSRSPNADTIELYRNVLTAQTNLYLGQKGGKDAGDICWPAFAEWFLSRKFDTKLKPSSWNLYRSAIIAYLERLPSDDAIYALAVLRTGDEDGYTPSGRERAENLKVKKFRPDDFDRTIYYCHCLRGQNNNSLITYLRANIRVGLRPVEFLTSEIRMIPDSNAPYGRQVWMFTCNAKYANGRANGPIRCLDLSAMDASAIGAITNCIGDARSQNQMVGYKAWLHSLNRSLRNVSTSSNSGLSDHYTAYSVRHQAIANWKSMYDPVTVAALAGHAMPSTARTHYGKARDAWPAERMENMIVRPSSADIARIRNRVLMAKERHKLAAGQQPMMDS